MKINHEEQIYGIETLKRDIIDDLEICYENIRIARRILQRTELKADGIDDDLLDAARKLRKKTMKLEMKIKGNIIEYEFYKMN
mgnify:CR=1 FL=1|jgi:hypothetical protein